MPSRRQVLSSAAILAASLPFGGWTGRAWGALPTASVAMLSNERGSAVWFDPVGLWVPPGTVVRWFIPEDQANAHAVASYHPANANHALRMPAGAKPWDSGYLLPGQAFETTLLVEGVYDYYCRPHEGAGMVGRLVVGQPDAREPERWQTEAAAHPEREQIPPEALAIFPSVADILARKIVPGHSGP